jgi:hypothetical protein
MYASGLADPNGLVPIGGHTAVIDSGDFEVYRTGRIVTHDSLIAVDKAWYAPKSTLDSCSFIVERIRVYLNDTLKPPPTGVYIGEAIDWDIPADTIPRNGSDAEPGRKLIYQWGCEEDGAGCQPNDRRWGGMLFLDEYVNGVRPYADLGGVQAHGAYTHDLATHVYPTSGLVVDTTYKYMAQSGYHVSDSTCADLYMLTTFDTLSTLLPGDSLTYYVGLVSHQNGSGADFLAEVDNLTAWYCEHLAPETCPCRKLGGDVNGDGEVNIQDLTDMIWCLFMDIYPCPCDTCPPACNIDCITGPAGPFDIADLTYLVAYLFQGGSPPVPCY